MNSLAPLTVPIVADDRIARSVFARMRAETATFARGMTIESAKVQASLGRVEAAMAGAQARALAFRSSITGLLSAGIGTSLVTVLGVREFVTNTIEAEQSLAQLEAALASTGGVAGVTSGQLTALAMEMQRATSFGDDAVVGAEALLLTFTKIGKDVFPDAVRSILDVSTAMKQDLQASTVQVGKALNDPIKGLTALSKAGIQFTEAQKTMIKTLVEAGDLVGAQRIMLKELETQFGGSARAARETLGGALTALGNSFGDLFEVGTEGSDDLRLGIERIIVVLSDPASIAAVQGFGGALFSGFADAIQEARRFGAQIDALLAGNLQDFKSLTFLPTAAAGTPQHDVGMMVHELTKLKLGIAEVGTEISETGGFYDQFGKTFEGATATATKAVDDMTAATDLAKDALRQGLAGELVATSDALKGHFAVAFGDASKAVKDLNKEVDIPLPRMRPKIDEISEGLKTATDAAVDFGQSLANSLMEGTGLAGSLAGALGSVGSSLLNQGVSGVGSAVQGAAAGTSTLASGLGLGSGIAGIVGGPIGSIVAGVGGSLLSRLFGDNEELEKAQEAWRGMQDEVQEFSAMLRGEVSGDMRSAIKDAHAQFLEYRKAAKEAGESTAALTRDFKRFRDEQIADFKRIFEARVDAYRTGLGADDPFLKGAEAMAALREEVLAFVDDARMAGGGRGRDAMRASRDFVLASIGGTGTAELSEYEAEVQRILGTRKQAIALLVDLGMKEKKAREQVNAQIELALAEARRIHDEAVIDRRSGFQDRLFAATTDLTTLAGQLEAFDRAAERERATELRNGAEAMAELEATLAAERLKIQRDFTDASIEEAKRAAEEMNRTARGIVDYVNGLNTGSDSPLSPQDRFTAAQAAFNSQFALAQGGNASAQASITQYADPYLDAAREMFASSEAFQEIFSTVKAQLLSLPAVTQSDDPVVQALVASQAAIVSALSPLAGVAKDSSLTGVAKDASLTNTTKGLPGIADDVDPLKTALGTLNTSIGDLNKTMTALNANTIIANGFLDTSQNYERGAFWGPVKQRLTEIVRNTALKKKNMPQDDGSGGIKDPVIGDPVTTGSRMGGMIPGYAMGGIVGNGVYDRDSVLARYAGGGSIALAGGEFVTRAPSVNAMTAPILDAINRTGRAPDNDNGRYFADQNRVLLAGFRGMIETLQSEIAMLRADVRRTGEGTTRAVKDKPVAKPATKVA